MADQYESAADSRLQAVVIANLQSKSSARAFEIVRSNPSGWNSRVDTDTRDEVDGRDAADGEDKSDVDDDQAHDCSEESVKKISRYLFSLVDSWIRIASKLLKPEESSTSFDKASSVDKSGDLSEKLEKMKTSWHIN